MSEQLQLRRGTASQVNSFTGAAGEVVFDTTNNRIVANDGITVGGYPIPKLSEVQTNSRTAISTPPIRRYSRIVSSPTQRSRRRA